ncbi:MAG: ISAzo13 family transposase [Thermoplasmataceae archaeon]
MDSKRREELIKDVKERYDRISGSMNELSKRLWAGNECISIGHGGIGIVSRATGMARNTVVNGRNEVIAGKKSDGRIRDKGAGRKKSVDTIPGLKEKLQEIVAPFTRGDPQSHLVWSSKSLRKLSEELKGEGYDISYRTVRILLREMDYTLKSNRKMNEGKSHADRNLQFEHINSRAIEFMKESQPVISIDTKKKELIGNLKNNGKEWKPKGEYDEVNVYDFIQLAVGKAVPYGIFDMKLNEGYVNVGIDHDTAEFAVQSIKKWWECMGKKRYPDAKRLMITADGGGSNGSRVKLWKIELQKFATETGLEISVCHFPPGTSKWNKIEHRLFSFITKNWRGKPLVSYEVIVNLIANTRTEKGLRVECSIDLDSYEKGIKISNDEMLKLNIRTDEFHGEWNYTISPRNIK